MGGGRGGEEVNQLTSKSVNQLIRMTRRVKVEKVEQVVNVERESV